jgi:hypothetical protein
LSGGRDFFFGYRFECDTGAGAKRVQAILFFFFFNGRFFVFFFFFFFFFFPSATFQISKHLEKKKTIIPIRCLFGLETETWFPMQTNKATTCTYNITDNCHLQKNGILLIRVQCIINNEKKQMQSPAECSYDPLLITCAEGLLETQHPFAFVAPRALEALLGAENAAQRVVSGLVPKDITPMPNDPNADANDPPTPLPPIPQRHCRHCRHCHCHCHRSPNGPLPLPLPPAAPTTPMPNDPKCRMTPVPNDPNDAA